LLAEAVNAARAAGSVELRLCTAQANLEALELFAKLGFEIVSRTPRFYPRGQDGCTLKRRL
jgi:ribosomal protein S18 acetylase RimI-like enzyme